MSTNFVSVQGKVHNFVNRLVTGGQVATFSLGFADLGKKGTFSYVNVNAWNLPEQIVEILSDGGSHSVLVTGHLKQESWKTKDDVAKTEVKVVADIVSVVPVRDRKSDPVEESTEPVPAPAQKPPAPRPVQKAPPPPPPAAKPVSKPAPKFVPQKPAPKPVIVEKIEDESPPWENDGTEDAFENEEAPF